MGPFLAQTARKFGGTGLGLAIARWIIDRHGGSAQVRSAPGKGGMEIRVVFFPKINFEFSFFFSSCLLYCDRYSIEIVPAAHRKEQMFKKMELPPCM